MFMELKDKLISYGLSEREADIYLSSMELGPSSVQLISKHAKVNRVSTYNFIEKLIKKGLISTYQDGKKNKYVASEPEALLNLFKQKKIEIQNLEEDFKKDLPEFNSKYNIAQGKPKVRYYEGLDGVVAMNEDTINDNYHEIITVYDFDLINKYFTSEVRERFQKSRVDKNINIKLIYSAKNENIENDNLRSAFKINSDTYSIPADIAIFGDKVRFISFSNKISGILIEDKQIAETLKTIFNLAIEKIKQ